MSTVDPISAVFKKRQAEPWRTKPYIFFVKSEDPSFLFLAPSRIVRELRRKGDMSGGGPSMANGQRQGGDRCAFQHAPMYDVRRFISRKILYGTL
jgi:hypothetical protein